MNNMKNVLCVSEILRHKNDYRRGGKNMMDKSRIVKIQRMGDTHCMCLYDLSMRLSFSQNRLDVLCQQT